jgi:hypothetical protein
MLAALRLKARSFAMTRRAGWFARMFGHHDVDPHADPDYASFEHVDASRMAAGEFHLSDSMRFDDAPVHDFSETLPAYSSLARPLPARAMHTRTGLSWRH